MPRYKPIHKGMKLLPVDFDQQIQPGSFEHALCYLVDHELDLSPFHARYKNDNEGAPAFDPAALIKIVLLAYSRGIVSSRKIEAACHENVLFIAVSGDSQPHFTTLAAFVSKMGDLAAKLFAQVLTICDRQGLIGRQMFAIDGVKLPSNASKAKSGTRADDQRQAAKMEQAAEKMLARHRAADAPQEVPLGDALPTDPEADRAARTLERLQREAKQMRVWLDANPEDRKGTKGAVRLSNRTDNDSAKMATSKGVIQGFTGVAAVDEKHQIVVEAQAHGTGYRKRDERYADQNRYQAKPDPLYDKRPKETKTRLFEPEDFHIDPEAKTCVCPAGKTLYGNGSNCQFNGYLAVKFQGAKQDCLPCALRRQCLRTPEKTATQQVAFFLGKAPGRESHTDRMKVKIDSDRGKQMITRRFATVEPVFGNLRGNKGLDRFTLRGRSKVDGQWKLYCLTHNIEKLAHHGYGS